MQTEADTFTVHKDKPADGGPAGWYVAENGVPCAFYSNKRDAERGAEIKRRLRAAWGAPR